MRGLLLTLVVLALAGCPTATPRPPDFTPIRAVGTYIHEPSGFVFPTSIDSFRRVVINQYDRAGLDVGIGYNLVEPEAEISFTWYVTPLTKLNDGSQLTLPEAFEAAIVAIYMHHSRAPVIARESVSTRQAGVDISGLRATFEYEEEFGYRTRQVDSLLYVFEFDGWLVQYRVTFPSSQRTSALVRLEQFLSALQWRGAA